MSKKDKGGGGGIPEWLVTFADLMSILVCFFVLLISFSIQDKQKLQVVAGSMKDAFGIQFVNKKAGMIEIEGAPVRQYVKQVALLAKKMILIMLIFAMMSAANKVLKPIPMILKRTILSVRVNLL